MKTNKKSKGFFPSLIKSFIFFTLAILGIYILIFIFDIAILFFNFISADNLKLLAYEDKLIEGKYNEIIENFDDDSSLTIYDENFEVIYISNKDSAILNEFELSLIPDINDYISVEKQTNENQSTKYHMITYSDDKDKNKKIILDDKYNIIYSDIVIGKDQLTKKEFYLLSGNVSKKIGILKLAYNADGKRMYATITHNNDKSYTKVYADSKEMIALTGYIFPFLFIIAVLIFIIRLDKKVKQPIEMLSNSIKNFSKEDNHKPIEYKGLKEFVEICDSFNELALKLNVSEIERQKAENEKKKMLSDISHDFKTPITVIKGYAQALQDDIIPEEKKDEYVKMIADKSIYLSQLITEFGEYTKLDRTDFVLKKENVDICDFARNYLIDSFSEIERSGLTLDADIPSESIYCEIDCFQMRRVFENIIANSIKYHSTGNTLYFSIINIEDKIIITICDNGVGIREDLRENIFKPFAMADKSRTEGRGTGLGMAIVEKIIVSHGGEIKLLPPNDKFNTIFEIRL